MAARIGAERAAWRAHPASPWSVAQAAALKACHGRNGPGGAGLSVLIGGGGTRPGRRDTRPYTVFGQEKLKAALATRRIAAGIDEPARHDQWLDALSMDT